MKILIINHYAGSPAYGMEFRPFYFAREWARMGHEVTIAAASWSHLRTRNPELQSRFASEIVDGIRYYWFRTPDYEGNGMRRGVNILAFLVQLLAYCRFLASLARNGAVIASSTYPFDMLPARLIAKLAQASLTFEVHDLWPLSPVEVSGMSPRHPFIRASQWAESFAYRNADRVVSMLPLAESYMRSRGLSSGKFIYIPNAIDLSDASQTAKLPELHQNALAELRARNRFVVGYAGSHGKANSLHTVLHAANELRNQPITFVLVGNGPEKSTLQRLSRELALDNVVFLPPLERAAVPFFLRAMDCLLITWRRTWIYRLGISPNKLLDYMMAERPVIQAVDAGNDPVAESDCGFSVPAEDVVMLAQAVLKMASFTAAQRHEMGRNGRRYAEAMHDIKKLAPRFLEIIRPTATSLGLVEQHAAPYIEQN